MVTSLTIKAIKLEVEAISGYFCCQNCVLSNGKGPMGAIFSEFLDVDKLFYGLFFGCQVGHKNLCPIFPLFSSIKYAVSFLLREFCRQSLLII